jgi:cytidylate kinase
VQYVAKGKKKDIRKKRLTICVCGLAGSGKSTLAKKLAETYKLRYYSGGDALKALAMEEGYTNIERGWWEGEEGMRFLKERNRDHSLDKMMDEKLLELGQKGNVVLDSWTMPWLLDEGFKIWLEASPEKRARRIAARDKISAEKALDALTAKEEQTRRIYSELYGYELGKDLKPFHLILDTDNLSADEVFYALRLIIDNCILRS